MVTRSVDYFEVQLRRIEHALSDPLLTPVEAYRWGLFLEEVKADLVQSMTVHRLRQERERLGDDGYLERHRVRVAMAAMWDIQFRKPATVRSRVGMVRLLQAAYGKDTRVRWSWPPTPRAQYAHPLMV